MAGPAAILSWAIGGVFVLFIAMSYAELSGMLPRTGAIVRYPQLSHGSYTGWVIGWTCWLSAVSVPAIEAEAVVTYVGGKFPSAGFEHTSHGVQVLSGWGIGFGVGLMALFFALSYFGIRLLGEWNRWFTWWKLLIPIATFCMLFVVFRADRRGPLHALEIGFVGATNWGRAGIHLGGWAALTGSRWGATPLYSALQASGIGALLTFSSLLLWDAGISPSGTGWIYLGTGTRTACGLGVNGYRPRALQRHSRFGIPWVSLIVSFAVGCVFFIPAPSWYKLVGFITSTTALAYIMGGSRGAGLPRVRPVAAPPLPPGDGLVLGARRLPGGVAAGLLVHLLHPGERVRRGVRRAAALRLVVRDPAGLDERARRVRDRAGLPRRVGVRQPAGRLGAAHQPAGEGVPRDNLTCP